MVKAAVAGLVILSLSGTLALAQDDAPPKSAAPDGAKVYFISPNNGDAVSSPVLVQFGLSGMGIAPAGVERENTGHHHLIVDGDLPSLDDYIPSSDGTYRHFGGGQTEAVIDLELGEHTLQLLIGNQDHLPHDPPVHSEKITIIVK